MTISTTIIFAVYALFSLVLVPILLSALDAIGDNRGLFYDTVNFLYNLILPRDWNNLGVLIPMLGSLFFQMFMNRYFFFVGTPTNAWIRFPFWYALFDYNLLYTNALLGLTVCVARVAMLFIFFLLFIARLDKTTMPGPRGGFLNYDPAYKAYIGMLRIDHRYNNPVFLEFGEIMLDVLRVTRIKTLLRRVRRMLLRDRYEAAIMLLEAKLKPTREEKQVRPSKKPHIDLSDAFGAMAPGAVYHVSDTEAGKIRLQASIRRLHLQKRLALWARRIVAFEVDRHRRRCVTVRNRWQLAWRCMQQPVLHRWRQDRKLRDELQGKVRQFQASEENKILDGAEQRDIRASCDPATSE